MYMVCGWAEANICTKWDIDDAVDVFVDCLKLAIKEDKNRFLASVGKNSAVVFISRMCESAQKPYNNLAPVN